MANRYWVGGTGTWDATALLKWSLTSGGVGGEAVPTASDNVYFDAASGAVTITLSGARTCLSFNSTSFTGTVAGTGSLTVNANAVYGAGATFTNTGTWTFAATAGTQQITTNGKTLDFPITKNSAETLQLQDNLTMGSTRAFTLTAGTLDLNNQTLSTGLFNSSNSNVRSIAFGTGKIQLTGNAAPVWGCGDTTNFTYTGTSRIELTYAGSTGARSIGTGGTGFNGVESNSLNFYVTAGTDTVNVGGSASVRRVYRTLDFTGFGGTIVPFLATIFGDLIISNTTTISASATSWLFAGTSGTKNITTSGKTFDLPLSFDGVGSTFVFQDALTQGSTRAFTIANGTVQLKSSATLTTGAFATSGTNQKYLQSTTPGTQATLTQASGTVNATYLSIKDINATGGATWNALWSSNNVDEGNNSGWVFGDPPIISAVEYTYALRSFTQPRRF